MWQCWRGYILLWGKSCAWAPPSGTGGGDGRQERWWWGRASLLGELGDEGFPVCSFLRDVGGGEELQQRLLVAPEVSLAQSLGVTDHIHPTVIAVLLGWCLLLHEGHFAPFFAQKGLQLPRHLLGVDGVALTVGIIVGEALFVPEVNQ